MNKLVIIGANGQGKVIADIAMLNGYTDIVFLDDNESIKTCLNFPVVGKTNETNSIDGDKIVAIGDPKIRERIQNEIKTVSLIHPNATISKNVEIGEGTVIMAGAIINPNTIIGKGCIINTASSIDHDCKVEDFVHVAVGAHLCGTVHIGKRTWIGAGTIITNNTNVCNDCTIGAGTIIIKNITESGTYIGAPAKKIK